MDTETHRSMTLPEFAAIAAVALLLVWGGLFVMRKEQATEKKTEHRSITAALRKIEAAKGQYATDKQLASGTWVTLSALQKSGYLSVAKAELPGDIHFVPGAVGENVTYHFADGVHRDHFPAK